MRKKPDILLLLSVLVVSGVIISNFVLIRHSKSNISLPDAQYSQSKTHDMMNKHSERKTYEFKMHDFNSQAFVHIDSSKQRIR